MFDFQNNVLELWSLFDFLMPGFLGTEKQFQARFGKPIIQSRDAKSSSKEQEAGTYGRRIVCKYCVVYVIVQFYPWLNFDFLLFYIHYHMLEQKRTMENQNRTKDKIKLQHMPYYSKLTLVLIKGAPSW